MVFYRGNFTEWSPEKKRDFKIDSSTVRDIELQALHFCTWWMGYNKLFLFAMLDAELFSFFQYNVPMYYYRIQYEYEYYCRK